jgi:ubiquinone/menaquinone biosynthesis C-methylase UbiE
MTTPIEEIPDSGPQERKWTLDAFAQHPFYQDINRRLVAITGLKKGQQVVDLGAGTGSVTRILAEQVANHNGEVIAIEPSETALEAARRNLENIGGAVVRLIQGSAERLSQIVRGPVDAVFFCNAIHLVSEKERVLQEIRRTLRKDGTFSFNTTFYNGAEPAESELFYRRWMMRALRALKTNYGIMPDKTRTEARHRLSEEEYLALLKSNGFKIKTREVVPVDLPLSSFETISEYSLWIEGVLPGVPFEAGCESLKIGARDAFNELGLVSSPRNWLLVVARRA